MDLYPSSGSMPTVTHAAPLPGDLGLMPCCGRTPFEVPRSHRMTLLNAVTCPGTAGRVVRVL